MALHTVQMIKETLEREYPELHPGNAIGTLAGFGISVIVSCLIGLGSYALLVEYGYLGGHTLGYLLSPFVMLGIAYGVGHYCKDSEASFGSELANSGAGYMADRGYGARHSGTYNAAEGAVAAGCLFFFLQFLFTNVYVTFHSLMSSESLLKEDPRSRIGAAIVHCLLHHGGVSQEELVQSLADQGVDPPQTRDVLVFLSEKKVVENRNEQLFVTPFKKDLFT